MNSRNRKVVPIATARDTVIRNSPLSASATRGVVATVERGDDASIFFFFLPHQVASRRGWGPVGRHDVAAAEEQITIRQREESEPKPADPAPAVFGRNSREDLMSQNWK